MKRKCIDRYDGPVTYGIDVSRWQGKIDWDEVAQDDDEIKFCIVRSGDGRSRDRNFVANVHGARDAGLRVGGYRYFRADRDGETQAELDAGMWESAGGFRLGEDIPIVLDIERGSRSDLPGGVWEGPGKEVPLDVVAEEALEYLSAMESVFRVRPMVYGGAQLHWWFAQIRPDLGAKFAEYPLWLPSYTRCARMPVKNGKGFPWKQWTIWQWSSNTEIDGIRGGVDCNRFRGDEVALAQFCKDAQSSTPPPECPA
jgi:lysozyme